MILSDLHTHTTFSDGKNTPEEMVKAAIQKGMVAIGFSDHSFTSFDPEPCMKKDAINAYQDEIRRLQFEYSKKIRIFCGIEQDFFSDFPAVGYDFIIGSVHYVRAGTQYLAVDDTPELLQEGVRALFGGDVYAMTDAYWHTVAQVVEKTGADIIGHLDLVRKFNRNGAFFDESHPRYREAALQAVDFLLKTGKPFEINTGAISRGYLDTPYPAPFLIEYIQQHGGRFVLSSDSHCAETLCSGFRNLSKMNYVLSDLLQEISYSE